MKFRVSQDLSGRRLCAQPLKNKVTGAKSPASEESWVNRSPVRWPGADVRAAQIAKLSVRAAAPKLLAGCALGDRPRGKIRSRMHNRLWRCQLSWRTGRNFSRIMLSNSSRVVWRGAPARPVLKKKNSSKVQRVMAELEVQPVEICMRKQRRSPKLKEHKHSP